MKLKKTLTSIAVSSALGAMFSPHLVAQESGEDLEVIQVKGIRASILTAQEIKKNADTVKDVISADDIGALPDKSVTEALMRVPGVTIERFASSDDPNHFAAEGTGIVVRGLRRVRSEINGRDSFSARTEGGGLNYEDFPGELLGAVEVVKNTTSDLIAGGVAGTVNLITRKPFDTDGMTFLGTVKGSYGDHREDFTPVLSGVFSNRWELDDVGEFGILVAAAKSEYHDRGDGVALDNFYERSATANEMPQFGQFGTALPGYEDGTYFVPAGIQIRTADSERERTGLSFSAQYRNPSNSFEATVEHIDSNAKLTWDERVLQYGEQGFNVNPNNSFVVNPTFDNRNFMTAGDVVMLGASLAQSRSRATEHDVQDTSAHFTFYPSDMLKVDFDVQRIESTSQVTDYTLNNRFFNDDYYFDTVNRDVPLVDFTGDNLDNPLTPEEMYINSAMDKEDDVDAESTAFAADLEYQLDDEWVSSVEAGAYMSTKKQRIRDSVWNWGEVANSWQSYADGGRATAHTGTEERPGHPELYEAFTFDMNAFHGGGVLRGDQTVLFPRMADVRNWIDYHANANDAGFSTFVPLRNRSCVTLSGECNLEDAYLPSEITSSEEERLEFYVKVNFENELFGKQVMGNVGLRHISWQVESSGATQFPDAIPGWDTARASRYTPEQLDYQNSLNTEVVTIKGDKYTKLLPSFNISFLMDESEDQSSQHIVRFAASQNVFFPNFADFRYFRTITESHAEVFDPETFELIGYSNIAFDGRTGNPNIEPEEATSLDITYEWYMSATNSLTVSLFRKELKNIIRTRLFVEDVTNELIGATGSPVTMPVNFQTTTNQSSGTITGFELAHTQFYDFLPGIWSGFGTQFNYTFIEQQDVDDSVGFGEGSRGLGGRNQFRAFKNLDLPGYSDHTVNAALIYQKDDVSARLAYNWRSEYLLTRRDADAFSPVIAEDTGQLDGSVSYAINENLKVGFEVTNLLDEIIKTRLIYNQEGETTPRSHFKTDRRFGVYVTGRF